MTLCGVILAGGRGRRMGGADKALLELGGVPMIARVIARLGPQVDALAISANGAPGRFAGFGLPVLPDTIAGHPGPLAGLLAGMRWAEAEGASHIVTAATDTPFLPADLVGRLGSARGAPIALAETARGLHPTFGLWPVSLAGALAEALEAGTRRVGAWALEQGAARVRFPAGPPDPFFNINTPADMEAAACILAKEHP
ncbi:MAG: molybdenum cofactor guanylyltransferase MobA [Rhodobacterales bacterium]|nr:MAG: molybdenum cofactor guanylyltransferase MobA [Rhodobacterales bacterium]